jgi:ATP-dependent exoDNAse (exonuclease V) alpha subunit
MPAWDLVLRPVKDVAMDSEGFEHARTVDRLLAELDQERDPRGRRGGEDGRLLDARTVLVVDEAGMLGSRKLARLLDHAQQAGAKVVLVGDDRQLAAIEAGGGFRGLRLRLGASELTENRRQQETWEWEAVEHLRNGDLDQALGAYRTHGRLVAAETPGQLKQILLSDWWQAFQQGERVAILAYRREEVDQFNTACQQLRQRVGQLGPDRLQVGDRRFAVGDVVVSGKNALRTLGVANGSRGQVLALDPQHRSMTVRLETGRRPPWMAATWTTGPPGGPGATPGGAPSTSAMPAPATGPKASPWTGPWCGSLAPRTASGSMWPPPAPPR